MLIAGCKNNKSSTGKFMPKSDTTKIQAVYIDFSDSLKIKNGVVFEIVRDAINVDSVLKVNKVKDSIFYYKPTNDTSEMWKMILRPAICTDRNIDTCVNRLSRVVKELKKDKKFTGMIIGKDSFGVKN
jgi:hypothetical protein